MIRFSGSTDAVLDTYGPGLQGNSDPGIPATIQGIKFDWCPAVPLTLFTLVTDIAPTWGDFYAKDGNAGGQGTNTAWNAGFTNPLTDPTNAPANGTPYGYYILRPDTTTTSTVPYPRKKSIAKFKEQIHKRTRRNAPVRPRQ